MYFNIFPGIVVAVVITIAFGGHGHGHGHHNVVPCTELTAIAITIAAIAI